MNCECVGTWRAPCGDCYRKQLSARIAESEPTPMELESQLQKAGVPLAVVSGLRVPLKATQALAAARAFLGAPRHLACFLVLLGSPGRGKSLAAAWVMREVLRRDGWNKAATGGHALPVEFVEASRLTRVSSYDKLDGQWMDDLATVPVLVLDDAGDEATTAGQDALSGLLLQRSAKFRRTVLTSNLRKEAFERRYGMALADRIRSSGVVVELAGKSMRPDSEARFT